MQSALPLAYVRRAPHAAAATSVPARSLRMSFFFSRRYTWRVAGGLARCREPSQYSARPPPRSDTHTHERGTNAIISACCTSLVGRHRRGTAFVTACRRLHIPSSSSKRVGGFVCRRSRVAMDPRPGALRCWLGWAGRVTAPCGGLALVFRAWAQHASRSGVSRPPARALNGTRGRAGRFGAGLRWGPQQGKALQGRCRWEGSQGGTLPLLLGLFRPAASGSSSLPQGTGKRGQPPPDGWGRPSGDKWRQKRWRRSTWLLAVLAGWGFVASL